MNEFINQNLAALWICAFVWVSFSSLFDPPIRGYRNLGILACYICLVVSLFIFPFRQILGTWVLMGLLGGFLYVIHDVILSVREKRLNVSFSYFIYGQIAWPIMGPEAIEYTLCNIGLLKSKGQGQGDGSNISKLDKEKMDIPSVLVQNDLVNKYSQIANWKNGDVILCCKITHDEIKNHHSNLTDHEIGNIVNQIRELNTTS